MRWLHLVRATLVATILLIGWFGSAAHAAAVEDDSFLPLDPYAAVAHELEAGEVRASAVQGVFGTDDRMQIAQTTASPYSMVTFILVEWSDGSVSSCSGFMVGPHTVGTAGHCVFDRSQQLGWAKRVLVSPGANGTQKPYGTFFATSVASVAGWAQSSLTTPSVDFAAITLGSDIGTTTGTFGLLSESDSALQGGSFTVAGYPGDKSSASLWSAAGPIDRVDAGLIYFRLDVTHGNSGGPIWKQTATGPSVVGIVEGGSTTTNMGVRVSQAVIDRYRSWAGGASDTPSIAPNVPVSITPATPTTLGVSAGSGRITSGTIPASGVGLIVFDGGTSEQLLTASGCPSSSAVFWVTDGAGFVTYIPGSRISSVNASWDAKFASTGIPSGTVIIARCR